MTPRPAPTAFEDKLRRALWPYPPADRYLVGVSGGRDSVALLHGLVAAGYRRLVVCHLDHRLRGEESTGDADFVRRLADHLKLPAEFGEADVRSLARAEKLSLETAARDARYRFFAATAARRRCRTVLLAHQADDQAETILFNLLRGAGPSGLAAMSVESLRTVGQRRLRVIRPLLAVWREEIDAHLRAQNISWRDDLTNADPAFGTRNRLRLEALPLLEKVLGRKVAPALWRTADILGAEEAWLAGLIENEGPLPTRLPLSRLTDQPTAKKRRIVRAWLGERGLHAIGYDEVELIRSLENKENGPAKVNLPGGWHARRRGGFLFLESPV